MTTDLTLLALSPSEWPIATPLLIAHRGVSARFPENTVAAFAACQAERCSAVELDVQMTLDGQLVAFHDADLARITGASGAIAEHSYSELSRLDAGFWKSSRFYGERIPRLEDLVPYWRGLRRVNLELKPVGNGYAMAEALTSFVRAHDLPLVVSSFDWDLLRYYRKRDPQASIAVLFEDNRWDEAISVATEIGAVAVNPDVDSVNAGGILKARLAGLSVNAYTVNDVHTAIRLARLGVTGLYTDDPTRLHDELEFRRGLEGILAEDIVAEKLSLVDVADVPESDIA